MCPLPPTAAFMANGRIRCVPALSTSCRTSMSRSSPSWACSPRHPGMPDGRARSRSPRLRRGGRLPLRAARCLPIRGWPIRARCRGAANDVFVLLADTADAVSAFETTPEEWRVEAYRQSPLLDAELGAQLALVAAANGGTLAEFGEEILPARDWLADNQLSFPRLRVGRVFVSGSAHDGKVPAGALGMAVDAASAFGTGEPPSARG